jgi:hypothetical protein
LYPSVPSSSSDDDAERESTSSTSRASLEDVSLDDRVIARDELRHESGNQIKMRIGERRTGDATRDDAPTRRRDDASRGAHAKTNKTKANDTPSADAATARASRKARADGAPT